jgi:hypothetical protein
VRDVDRSEALDIPLVESKEFPAGGKIIVDNIEDFTIDILR